MSSGDDCVFSDKRPNAGLAVGAWLTSYYYATMVNANLRDTGTWTCPHFFNYYHHHHHHFPFNGTLMDVNAAWAASRLKVQTDGRCILLALEVFFFWGGGMFTGSSWCLIKKREKPECEVAQRPFSPSHQADGWRLVRVLEMKGLSWSFEAGLVEEKLADLSQDVVVSSHHGEL